MRRKPPASPFFIEKCIDARERFSALHGRGDACWEWSGARDRAGYGVIFVAGAMARAPRVSLILSGRLPTNECPMALHHCDNPICVRPEHLYWGSAANNHDDMVARGRRASVAGSRNPNARITAKMAKAMIAARRSGHTMQRIAGDFGVSVGSVWSVLNKPR